MASTPRRESWQSSCAATRGDMQTDRLVQSAARKRFTDRTVMIIAHRLDTVRECNRIAVMDAGRLVEIGPPSDLLDDPSSQLSKLHNGGVSHTPEGIIDL